MGSNLAFKANLQFAGLQKFQYFGNEGKLSFIQVQQFISLNKVRNYFHFTILLNSADQYYAYLTEKHECYQEIKV